MKIFALCVCLAIPSVASAQAPFCVVSAYGEDCNYFSVEDCKRTAGHRDGACVARQQAQQPQIQYFDIAGSAQRGFEAGQRMRIEREEHEARMQQISAEGSPAQTVNYVCSGRDGMPYRTTVPSIGCVVKSIGDD